MVSYLSEPRCPVYPRAVDEQRMEEHRVSLLHDKVNLGTLLVVINNPVEKLVCLTLGEKNSWVEITRLKLEQGEILCAGNGGDSS